MDNKLRIISLRNVALAGLYIFGVSQFMFYAEKLLADVGDHNLAPFAFLLLFSLSAAVVGSLIFGQAIAFFLEGRRSEGLKSAVYSILWLLVLTILVIIGLVSLN